MAETKAETRKNIEDVAETLNKSSNVNVVFGSPMELDDGSGSRVVIIPVAKSFVMGGGGGGQEPGMAEGEPLKSGSGTGLFARSVPLGYIRVANGNVEFVDIVDRSGIILKGMLVGGFVSFMLIRMLRKIYG
jgi:uncharacterized spore protein YtfJ